ncbi:leucine-rich repeat protein [Tanacetum coccineum]
MHTCLCARNISAICAKQERLALLKFINSVYDVADMLSSWVGSESQWERVHGVQEWLVGNEVSSSLRHLRILKFLDLSANDFRGSRIPEFIGSFKQLSYLNLSNSYFSGVIPPHIRNISYLKVLDLGPSISSYNTLMLDDMSWIFGLSLLMYLDLSNVDLSKARNHEMVFYLMPSLEMLSLSGCSLTNVDLDTLSNSSTTLANTKHLDLGYNSFKDLATNMLNSSVPIMPNLLRLDLSECNFTHIEDFGIRRQCHLKELSVSANLLRIKVIDAPKNVSECSQYAFERLHLDGSLKEILGLMRSDGIEIQRCYLDYLEALVSHYKAARSSRNPTGGYEGIRRFEDYHGDDSLGRIVNLKGLSLSGNELTCLIPESLGRLRLLEELDLSDNQLTGPILTFIGKLTTLDLSSNQLNGLIPESFGSLTSLKYLDLSVNELTGPIPTSLGRLVSLQLFLVHSNSLNGTVPVFIGRFTKFRDLEISKNSLERVITEAHFAKLSMLKYLDTSSNSKLTFIVSREWKPPFQLIIVDLSSSKIINGFPRWFRTQKKLKGLMLAWLSNASITGPLPTWCLAWMLLLELYEVYCRTSFPDFIHVMAISVISVSSDSSEDSVGTPAGRVILFGTIPTTIPDTTPVITLPTTQTDTTVIPTGIPIIAPTIPPSPDYTLASPDYSPASDTEFDPSEDPSSDHIPPLPAISPFLSSTDDTTDS